MLTKTDAQRFIKHMAAVRPDPAIKQSALRGRAILEGLRVSRVPFSTRQFQDISMRIHTDHNGVAVNAIHSLSDGTNVEGHVYQVLSGRKTATIEFQRGPVKENGVNGLTNEALLAILLHRTQYLDSQFPCDENKKAFWHMENALELFEERTKNRQARGVEGHNLE